VQIYISKSKYAAKSGYPNTETGGTGDDWSTKYGRVEYSRFFAFQQRREEYNESRFDNVINRLT
jgi:hypothetical protein